MSLEAWLAGARWALAGILVVSAVAKIAQRGGLPARARDVQAMGIPGRIAPAVAWALPFVEVLLAAGLVLDARVAPAVLAFLLATTVLMVRVLRRGDDVTCRCFGALTSRPLSMRSLARNGVLVVAAVTAVVAGGGGELTWTAFVWFLVLFGVVVIA